MELQTLQQSILIMAVIIGIGSLIGYRQPLTADSRQLVITIIVNVAMPCIILDGIFQTTIDQQILYQIFAIFFISIILNCLGIFIGWLGARALPLPVKNAERSRYCPAWGIQASSACRFVRHCLDQKERFWRLFSTQAWMLCYGQWV